MMILQSKIDGEDCTSENQTSLPSQSHHYDREELRQELLGKVCFSSSVFKKPKPKQPPKDDEATVVVKEDEGTDDVQHHDTEDAKPQRSVAQSIHNDEQPSGDHSSVGASDR
ncbi:hypothetical protein QTG54_011208 [Skeletonema marinoi]|uniref:Uncharacterized protein n=1 Tax=Skeletonema marinoi TaxID=267567 RepID=A0AAD8Y2E0_9STRA|nr:hypothetical protein QTG54_011208 [Skeletonema marinoi]